MKKVKPMSFVAAVFAAALLLGVSAAWAGEGGLVSLLTSQLGVTETQARGGAGALFSYAKDKLGASYFAKVAEAVPGMAGFLGAAPKSEGVSGALGGASSLLGKAKDSGAGIMSLAGQFAQLGLGGDMIGKFVPILVSYVKSSGGDTVAGLLAGALK